MTAPLQLLVLLMGCRHAVSPEASAVADAAVAPAVERFPFASITDASCTADGCVVLVDGALRRHTGETIGALPAGACPTELVGGPDAWGPCPPAPAWTVEEDPPPVEQQVARFRVRWNAAIAGHTRLPFLTTLATPDGGVIALARGGGQGQLFRSGGMPKMVPVPTSPSPSTWPAPLALHPSGTEAYLLPWPTPVVRAFDPFTLATRWTVSVEGAGQGLFVDPAGRFLLVAAGPGEEDRFADHPLLQPSDGAPWISDPMIWASPRPPYDHVAVIDVAAHTLAARAPGRYRRWFPFDKVAWIVTDREVVRIPVGTPPG